MEYQILGLAVWLEDILYRNLDEANGSGAGWCPEGQTASSALGLITEER